MSKSKIENFETSQDTHLSLPNAFGKSWMWNKISFYVEQSWFEFQVFILPY